jgi:hypothetical protein
LSSPGPGLAEIQGYRATTQVSEEALGGPGLALLTHEGKVPQIELPWLLLTRMK